MVRGCGWLKPVRAPVGRVARPSPRRGRHLAGPQSLGQTEWHRTPQAAASPPSNHPVAHPKRRHTGRLDRVHHLFSAAMRRDSAGHPRLQCRLSHRGGCHTGGLLLACCQARVGRSRMPHNDVPACAPPSGQKPTLPAAGVAPGLAAAARGRRRQAARAQPSPAALLPPAARTHPHCVPCRAAAVAVVTAAPPPAAEGERRRQWWQQERQTEAVAAAAGRSGPPRAAARRRSRCGAPRPSP